MKEFSTSPDIIVYYSDGEIDKLYPVGEKEVKESIELWNQSLYSGEITKFEAVYEYRADNKLFRHTETYTEYDVPPAVTEEEINEVAELRKSVGMNLTQFSKFTGIPYRTLQNWESNTSQCPNYIISLLKTCVKHKEVWYSENYLTSYARTKKR